MRCINYPSVALTGRPRHAGNYASISSPLDRVTHTEITTITWIRKSTSQLYFDLYLNFGGIATKYYRVSRIR